MTTVEARQIHLWRAVATVIAALLYGLGWISYKTLSAVVWCGAAVKVGWREAHRGRP